MISINFPMKYISFAALLLFIACGNQQPTPEQKRIAELEQRVTALEKDRQTSQSMASGEEARVLNLKNCFYEAESQYQSSLKKNSSDCDRRGNCSIGVPTMNAITAQKASKVEECKALYGASSTVDYDAIAKKYGGH